MNPVQSRALSDKQRAIGMMQHAAEMRLSLWLERLAQRHTNGGADGALDRVLDAAVSVASADCANIQLLHPGGRLVLKAHRGFGRHFLDFFATVEHSGTACGLALQERRPVTVSDVVCSPIFTSNPALEVVLGAGIRAVISTPLIGPAGETHGILSVHYRRPRAVAAAEITRLVALAGAVAARIERA
jgi:GAF domain-containing protein